MSEAREQSYERLLALLVEAAEGSLDLDGQIYCAINGLVWRSTGKDGRIHHEPDKDGTHTMLTPHPYTTSLDAALTLVPEGWYWRCGRTTSFQAWAFVNRVHPDHANPEDEHSFRREHWEAPSTVPLALVIAALKARSAL